MKRKSLVPVIGLVAVLLFWSCDNPAAPQNGESILGHWQRSYPPPDFSKTLRPPSPSGIIGMKFFADSTFVAWYFDSLRIDSGSFSFMQDYEYMTGSDIIHLLTLNDMNTNYPKSFSIVFLDKKKIKARMRATDTIDEIFIKI